MSEPSGRSKILVVDDVRAQRLAIEAVLAELGEEIVCVGSGGEALRLLLEHDVAVILLDVNMPGMDGFETASLIRARPRSSHTPIIFLTAHTDEMAAARAYSLGAVDYIFSPFPPDVLRAKVRVFVELSKMNARVQREAAQRIALSREQAARAAAEDESRRLRVLAEASGTLARSLDTFTLVADLLSLFVPLMADTAAIALVGGADGATETSWVGAEGSGRVSHDPIVGDGDLQLDWHLQRVTGGGKPETLRTSDGRRITGAVVPLVARGRTFGAMGLGFVRSSREYREPDIHLIHDIAGRAAVALDNSQLYQEIQQRDRQKDEFLAMLSHELRNPLGAIATAVRLLEMAGVAGDRAVHARAVISRQTAHLSRIVDDLLDVARLTVGQIALAPVPLDLSEVVTRAVEALRLAGHLENHRVSVQAEPVTVEADFARMEQVVTNLVVNAVKYTDQGGRVEVELRRDGNEATIRVRDTGIGISAEMLPRLFDLFAQGGQALDRAQGGLGIGLTLVRRLVELQGGRVDAASEGLGRGSVFSVRLPLAARSVTGPSPIVAPQPMDVARLRILVVEDNDDAREMLRTLLQMAGHEVHEAADGLEALQVAGRVRPDVALIDIGLPGLDGLEVASRLRAGVDGNRPLLAAVTGYGQMNDRRKAIDAGFDLHLTKPVDPERLNEALSLAARRCSERRDVEARRA